MASGLDCSEECRQAGANDFILKPFMPDSLIERIRKLI
jgi:DNA-binding response OmpR family regulator